MDLKKFAVYASVVGAVGLANDVGFRANCEVHENEPACKGSAPDPLHSHQELPYAYGTRTDTSTATNSGGGGLAPPSAGTLTATMTAVAGLVAAGPQTYPRATGITITNAATGQILNT
jgi:hypothetical protein